MTQPIERDPIYRGRRFKTETIELCVCWYITYRLSYRDLAAMIRVAYEQLGKALRKSVSDTGPGIPQDLVEVVFQRFRQAGHNDRRGLGFGLYISRALIEAQSGRIWAESTLGNGTKIAFTLPAP